MREKAIESYFRTAIQKRGGRALKFVSPGADGVPDRLVLMPGGVAGFAEIKAPGKHVRPDGLQAFWLRELSRLGFPAREVSSKAEADEYAKYLLELSRNAARENCEEEKANAES